MTIHLRTPSSHLLSKRIRCRQRHITQRSLVHLEWWDDIGFGTITRVRAMNAIYLHKHALQSQTCHSYKSHCIICDFHSFSTSFSFLSLTLYLSLSLSRFFHFSYPLLSSSWMRNLGILPSCFYVQSSRNASVWCWCSAYFGGVQRCGKKEKEKKIILMKSPPSICFNANRIRFVRSPLKLWAESGFCSHFFSPPPLKCSKCAFFCVWRWVCVLCVYNNIHSGVRICKCNGICWGFMWIQIASLCCQPLCLNNARLEVKRAK